MDPPPPPPPARTLAHTHTHHEGAAYNATVYMAYHDVASSKTSTCHPSIDEAAKAVSRRGGDA